MEDHDRNLIQFLERARKINLKLNSSKIKFKQSEIPYIGHIITANGLKPCPERIRAITDMKRPSCVKEVKQFIGTVNYLAKFVKNLSSLTEPLRRLEKKDVIFSWEKEQEESF